MRLRPLAFRHEGPISFRMRLIFPLLFLALLASFAPLSLFRAPATPARSVLAFTPVPLADADPQRRKVGDLLYLGGWSIRSNDPRFGGISAMHVEGGEVTAVSDAGSVFRFPLPGSPSAPVSIGPLADGPGAKGSKGNRDSESMAVHRGHVWIGFEGANEIWRYARSSGKPEAKASPAAMESWPGNGGSEAMVRLADGRFIVFAESKERPDGSTEAIRFSGDPTDPGTKAEVFGYAAPKGYRITDAAVLPDGRLLFLNRRVGLAAGISAKLTLSQGSEPKGDILFGREIAHLKAPLTVDNMEALSVTQENGRTILWIASDDNFLSLQRTLLMKFALIE